MKKPGTAFFIFTPLIIRFTTTMTEKKFNSPRPSGSPNHQPPLSVSKEEAIGDSAQSKTKTRYLNHDYLIGAHETLDWQADPDLNHFFLQSPTANAHWSIAWSDLMMTMFILFLVMFVYKVNDLDFLSRSNLNKPLGSILNKETSNTMQGGALTEYLEAESNRKFTQFYDFSRLNIERNALKEFAAIDLAPDRTIKIVISGDLLFGAGDAIILPSARKSLEQIAATLKNTPYQINVVGHTDNQPIKSTIYPSNWELSAGRAGAVARLLINETKLPPEQLFISGFAQFQPTTTNDTPANRALNRRVEIIIINDQVGKGTENIL